MATKVEGWCYNNTASKDPHFAEWTGPYEPVGWRDHPTRLTQQATLVIHDDKSERVFTESEVRAIAVDVLSKIADYGLVYDTFRKQFAQHGIVLDPT